MPVTDGEEVVGNLTESAILNKLLVEPEARTKPVRDVMSDPVPVVPATLQLDDLSSFLEQGAGAVLVELAPDGGFDIVTKSDVIAALAQSARGTTTWSRHCVPSEFFDTFVVTLDYSEF